MEQPVVLDVYDLNGKIIETLLDAPMTAGTNQIQWNGSNHSSGIYLFKLTVGIQSQTVKAIYLK